MPSSGLLVSYYEPLWEKIQELSASNDISDILEIGCESGLFVAYLRAQGYNAEGIDSDADAIKLMGIQNLKQGFAQNLRYMYGDKQFDLIAAQSVFSLDSRIWYVGLTSPKIGLFNMMERDPEIKQTVLELDGEEISRIVESCYGQLRPGGFFVVHEGLVPAEVMGFPPSLAEEKGFTIVEFDDYIGVMQKPE